MIPCTYTYNFTVDEFGRPSGRYSLSDLPVHSHKELTRCGFVESKDIDNSLYEIRDMDDNFRVVVPMKDVLISTVDNNGYSYLENDYEELS